MNLYDRDYYRDEEEEQGWSGGAARDFFGSIGVVHYLILINAVLWLAGMFTPVTAWEVITQDGRHASVPVTEKTRDAQSARQLLDGKDAYVGARQLSDFLALRTDFWKSDPWGFWRLLTCGFVHAPWILHVLMNMYGLFVFGRGVEEKLGRREFLAVYLVAIVFAGLVSVGYHAAATAIDSTHVSPHVLGASGAVYSMLVLYALNFPNHRFQFILLPGVNIPAWGLAVGYVAIDLIGSLVSSEPIAYEAHLGGVAFALLYHYSGMNFTSWMPQGPGALGEWFSARPQLRVHHPDDEEVEDKYPEPENFDDDEPAPTNWDVEGDRLLAKINRQGIESLSPSEREMLEEYSRRMRNRRR